MNQSEKVANFERIEGLVLEGKLAALSSKEIRSHRDSLLRYPPLSENPKFQQRLERVEAALSAQISEKRSWWEKPFGIVVLTVVGSVAAAGIAFYLGWV